MAVAADPLRALGLDIAVATRETRYYPDDILTSEGPYGFTTKGSSNTNDSEEVFGEPLRLLSPPTPHLRQPT